MPSRPIPRGSYIIIDSPAVAPFPWRGVTGGSSVRVRVAPSTQSPIVRVLRPNTSITLLAFAVGEAVEANNDHWYAVEGGGYVWSGLVQLKESV